MNDFNETLKELVEIIHEAVCDAVQTGNTTKVNAPLIERAALLIMRYQVKKDMKAHEDAISALEDLMEVLNVKVQLAVYHLKYPTAEDHATA